MNHINESYVNNSTLQDVLRTSRSSCFGHLAPQGVADPEALARAGRAQQDCRAAHQLERTVFHGWDSATPS